MPVSRARAFAQPVGRTVASAGLHRALVRHRHVGRSVRRLRIPRNHDPDLHPGSPEPDDDRRAMRRPRDRLLQFRLGYRRHHARLHPAVEERLRHYLDRRRHVHRCHGSRRCRPRSLRGCRHVRRPGILAGHGWPALLLSGWRSARGSGWAGSRHLRPAGGPALSRHDCRYDGGGLLGHLLCSDHERAS